MFMYYLGKGSYGSHAYVRREEAGEVDIEHNLTHPPLEELLFQTCYFDMNIWVWRDFVSTKSTIRATKLNSLKLIVCGTETNKKEEKNQQNNNYLLSNQKRKI